MGIPKELDTEVTIRPAAYLREELKIRFNSVKDLLAEAAATRLNEQLILDAGDEIARIETILTLAK